MSSRIKRYLVVVGLFILVLGSQLACDEGGKGGGRGADWLRCESVTCTYKTKVNGDTKTAISGVRINRANAVALSGKWISVN